MKIMRAALHTHSEWFKLQMWKDRFEELLKIDHLKEVDVSVNSNSTSKQHADNWTYGSSQTPTCSSNKLEDGSSPSQVSSSENVCDEGAILKVMVSLYEYSCQSIYLCMKVRHEENLCFSEHPNSFFFFPS